MTGREHDRLLAFGRKRQSVGEGLQGVHRQIRVDGVDTSNVVLLPHDPAPFVHECEVTVQVSGIS